MPTDKREEEQRQVNTFKPESSQASAQKNNIPPNYKPLFINKNAPETALIKWRRQQRNIESLLSPLFKLIGGCPLKEVSFPSEEHEMTLASIEGLSGVLRKTLIERDSILSKITYGEVFPPLRAPTITENNAFVTKISMDGVPLNEISFVRRLTKTDYKIASLDTDLKIYGIPGFLKENGIYQFRSPFDLQSKERITLSDFLEEVLFFVNAQPITIKHLIRDASNRDGAHWADGNIIENRYKYLKAGAVVSLSPELSYAGFMVLWISSFLINDSGEFAFGNKDFLGNVEFLPLSFKCRDDKIISSGGGIISDKKNVKHPAMFRPLPSNHHYCQHHCWTEKFTKPETKIFFRYTYNGKEKLKIKVEVKNKKSSSKVTD